VDVEKEKKAIENMIKENKQEKVILFLNAWQYYVYYLKGAYQITQKQENEYKELIDFIETNYPELMI